MSTAAATASPVEVTNLDRARALLGEHYAADPYDPTRPTLAPRIAAALDAAQARA